MRLTRSLVPALVGAVLLFPTAARADQHDRRDRGRPQRIGIAVPRHAPHAVVAPRYQRPVIVAPRYQRPVVISPRYYRAPVIVSPRVVVPYRSYSYRPYPYYAYSYRPYTSYSYRPYTSYSYRPYTFRPHFRIGFGVFVGYPVPYTYAYPYRAPVHGYPYPPPVAVTPGPSAYGGVSLDITPIDAEVWVDGAYAGTVRDFDGTRQPLTLIAGRHRIELRAYGYAPLVFDAMIQPGQVIPYRGDLQVY